VPIDEEQPEFALDISGEAKRTLQARLMSSGVTGILSLIPGVGAAVTELMTEVAIQRTNERVNEMFGHFTNRIREVGEDKVDRDWFRGAEFQTLLYEAMRQLHVTHDREKVEMLGVALANSGTSGFRSEERKDLFIHFVRDLTRQHVKLLIDLIPRPLRRPDLPPMGPNVPPLDERVIQQLTWHNRRSVTPKGDDLLALQMLHAYGLVEEEIRSSVKEPNTPVNITSQSQLRSAWREILNSLMKPVVTRSFRLSPLGNEFLKFMGLPKNNEATVASELHANDSP